MAIKLTAKQERDLFNEYIASDSEGREALKLKYPGVFPDDGTQPEPTAAEKKVDPNDWTKRIGLRRVTKQRIGYDLMVTFHCALDQDDGTIQEFRVSFDVKTLLKVGQVRDQLVAATERVPIMPATKDWPAAVERLLKLADSDESEQISRHDWMIEQVSAYLATGLQVGDTTGTRDGHLFEMVGGNGTVHSVLDTHDNSIIIHQDPLVTWIAKRSESDRKSLEYIVRTHLRMMFDEYRIPGGKGRRGYWKQRIEILRDRDGIDLPRWTGTEDSEK